MTSRQWIRIVLVTAAMAGAVPGRLLAQQPPAVASGDAEAAAKDLAQQEAILNNTSAAQEQKEEAARRLVSRSTREAREILRRTLDNPANRSGQIAVARGLAADPNPDVNLIPLLVNVMGPDAQLSQAAAQALAAYKGNDDARQRLYEFARNTRQPLASRTMVIRAMGRLVAKRAAENLIALLQSESNETIRNALCDALVEMTGLRENGRDLQRWIEWWSRTGNRSEAEWAEELLQRKSKESNELQARFDLLRQQTERFLSERYGQAPDPQKLEVLMPYLQSDAPEIRLVGVRILYEDFRNSKGVPPEAKQRLRAMVGDSSTEVRQEVVRTLGAINDPGAVDALLAQLPQEADVDVRAAIATALGPTRDLRAVEPLLLLLNEPANRVSENAAEALSNLAAGLVDTKDDVKKAELSARVATQLRNRLRQTDWNPAAGKLREQIVNAMAALRNPANLSDFYALLGRTESAAVRRHALRGLKNIGNPDSADAIVNSLSDPDAGVRLDAADALGPTASFAHAEALAKLLDPSIEHDESVRKHVWEVLKGLFAKGTPQELYRWADRFRGANTIDRERRREVLMALEIKLGKEGSEEELAKVRQNIGQVDLELGKSDEAVTKLRAALEYWKKQNAPEAVMLNLGDQYMLALVRARDYAGAVDFAEQTIKADVRRTGEMGAQLRKEAERLRDTRDFVNCLKLVEESKKIWKLLGNPYEGQLRFIEEEARKGQTAGGRGQEDGRTRRT